jgi:hypothetical protein
MCHAVVSCSPTRRPCRCLRAHRRSLITHRVHARRVGRVFVRGGLLRPRCVRVCVCVTVCVCVCVCVSLCVCVCGRVRRSASAQSCCWLTRRGNVAAPAVAHASMHAACIHTRQRLARVPVCARARAGASFAEGCSQASATPAMPGAAAAMPAAAEPQAAATAPQPAAATPPPEAQPAAAAAQPAPGLGPAATTVTLPPQVQPVVVATGPITTPGAPAP